MRILYLSFSALVVLIFHPTWAIGHSADELKRIFDPGPVPQELEAATKELDRTAGMKSIREEAHAKQHILLDQYVRALTERKCRESIANISELDQAIVERRDRGQIEEENDFRQIRQERRAFRRTGMPRRSQ